MSNDPKVQVNNHNTNIYIINSGDLNPKNSSFQQTSSLLYFNPSSSNARGPSTTKSRPGNRSFMEWPFFDGEDDISNRIPDESGRSLDLFPPSGSLQPQSKLISESSNRRRPSYDDSSLLEFESVRRSKPKSNTLHQKAKPNHEADHSHISEPFSFVPDPGLELGHERSVPKVTHLPSSAALAFAQYKTDALQKKKEMEALKSQSDLQGALSGMATTGKIEIIQKGEKGENDQNFQRSSSSPVMPKKKKFGSIFRSSAAKTQVFSPKNKKPSSGGTSVFSRFFQKAPSIVRSNTPKRSMTLDQLNLINDVSVPEATLRRHGPKKLTGIDLNPTKGNRQPLLVSYMMKHAGNPKNKEGEIFSKVLGRLHPEKLEQLKTKKRKGWKQNLIVQLLIFLVKFFFSIHSPDSAFIIGWNFVGLILVIFNCFYVPFLASFLFSYSGIEITIPLNLFFAVDIILTFRTAYYSKGLLILSSRKIIRHSINLGTAMDLLSVLFGVLYLFDLDQDVLKYLTFFTLYRGLKMTPYIQRIEDHFQFGRVIAGLSKLVRLVLFIYIVAHVGGCIFYILGVSQNSVQVNTWLREYTQTYTNIVDVYVMAVYWSFTTMITVGYGDITPQNVTEQIYTIIMMAMAGGVFGYSLNTIGLIVNDVTEASAFSREKIRQITKYMKRKRLSRGVQMRVRKYLEYILEGEMVHRQEEDKLLKMLSEPLKEEIVAEINLKALMDLRVLSLSFSQRLLTKLARELKERMLSPEEYLFKDGESDDHSIYYITGGNVHLCYDRCNKEIKILNRGEFFGEIAFFSNRERTAGAKSFNFSSVFQLSREDFLAVVQDFPTDKETFYNIQDKINFEKDFSNLGIVCFTCQNTGHFAQNCPKNQLFFSEDDKKLAIVDFMKTNNQIRRDYQRRVHKRFNPKLHTEQLQNDSIKIKSNEAFLRAVNEPYDNLSDDSFDEVLDRKVYGKGPREPVDTGPVIDSLDSVEGAAHVGSLRIQREFSQRDSIYPFQPPGSSKPIFGGTLGNLNSYPFPMFYGSGADGNSSPDRRNNPMAGSVHFPSSQQFKFYAGGVLLHVTFDTVCNFESYYTHGNINVISQKINVPAMERLIQKHFEKRGKKDVQRNTFKAIDILSRGSVFRSVRRESSDSLGQATKLARKKSNEQSLSNQDILNSRRGSILSAGLHGSGFLVSGSPEFPNRKPSVFRANPLSSNPNSRHGSMIAHQGSGAAEGSVLSHGSYMQMDPPDAEESTSPVLRPSRFSYLRAENQSPLKKGEGNNPRSPVRENAEENLEKLPSPVLVSGSALQIRTSSNVLQHPSTSSLKIRRNSGSRESDSSSSVVKVTSSQMDNTPSFKGVEKGKHRKNSSNARGLMLRQDTNGTDNEHPAIAGVSNITFQQKNSDEAASSLLPADGLNKQILKHLWQAMDKMAKGELKRKGEGSRFRRSNSVGAQSQVEKLLEEFGLREILSEFLKLSSNSSFFMKENLP